MKAILNKKEEVISYEIDGNSKVHKYIDNPGYWHLSIKELGVFRHQLCPIDSNENQVKESVLDFLKKYQENVQQSVSKIIEKV